MILIVLVIQNVTFIKRMGALRRHLHCKGPFTQAQFLSRRSCNFKIARVNHSVISARF